MEQFDTGMSGVRDGYLRRALALQMATGEADEDTESVGQKQNNVILSPPFQKRLLSCEITIQCH
jgi:hypothetical protein